MASFAVFEYVGCVLGDFKTTFGATDAQKGVENIGQKSSSSHVATTPRTFSFFECYLLYLSPIFLPSFQPRHHFVGWLSSAEITSPFVLEPFQKCSLPSFLKIFFEIVLYYIKPLFPPQIFLTKSPREKFISAATTKFFWGEQLCRHFLYKIALASFSQIVDSQKCQSTQGY